MSSETITPEATVSDGSTVEYWKSTARKWEARAKANYAELTLANARLDEYRNNVNPAIEYFTSLIASALNQ